MPQPSTRRRHRLVPHIVLVVLAACVASEGGVLAQDLQLGGLSGRWEGTGTVLGRPAEVTLEWQPVLGGRFTRLTFVNAGLPFEGHAYYRDAGNGRYEGTWFDSTGVVRPITARAQPGAIVARWGTPDTEEGETTYRLLPDGRLEVVDRVKGRNGAWREFGRSTLARR